MILTQEKVLEFIPYDNDICILGLFNRLFPERRYDCVDPGYFLILNKTLKLRKQRIIKINRVVKGRLYYRRLI